MAVDKLVDSTQLNNDLTSVANAIRAKSGGSGQLAFPSGFVSEIGNIDAGETIEVPKKWKRPSDWPNLDLIDVSQPRSYDTSYITIFCDGTWDYLCGTESWANRSCEEIKLNSDGTETVIQTLSVSTYGKQVDISNLSNGIHLIKGVGTLSYLGLNLALYQKTLEAVFIGTNNPTQVINLNTGNYYDWLPGGSKTLQRISVNWMNSRNNYMLGWFIGCTSLKKIEINNCKNIGKMGYFIRDCSNLIELVCKNSATVLPSLYINLVINSPLLETFDLTGLDFSLQDSNIQNALNGCYFLTNFSGLLNCSRPQVYSNCINLTHQSLLNIINALPTVSASTTLTLGATNQAKLTSDEIAIATAKGWTVA